MGLWLWGLCEGEGHLLVEKLEPGPTISACLGCGLFPGPAPLGGPLLWLWAPPCLAHGLRWQEWEPFPGVWEVTKHKGQTHPSAEAVSAPGLPACHPVFLGPGPLGAGVAPGSSFVRGLRHGGLAFAESLPALALHK